MKTMPWFKLHTEFRSDPKIQHLSDAQHRVWFNLLCFASDQRTRGVISNISRGLLAIEVAHGQEDVLIKTLECLEFLGIVSLNSDGDITFCDFAERQYYQAVRQTRSDCRAQAPFPCCPGDETTVCH